MAARVLVPHFHGCNALINHMGFFKTKKPHLLLFVPREPGWKICLFLPTRSCDKQQFFRCDMRAKPILCQHATKSKELLAKPSQFFMSCMRYYPFPFLLVLNSSWTSPPLFATTMYVFKKAWNAYIVPLHVTKYGATHRHQRKV